MLEAHPKVTQFRGLTLSRGIHRPCSGRRASARAGPSVLASADMFDHKRPLLAALAFALALGAAGCNPHGTCISGDESSDLGAMCALDYPEKACSTMSGSTFYKEDKAAGLLRCKGLGFEQTQGGGPNTLFKIAKKK